VQNYTRRTGRTRERNPDQSSSVRAVEMRSTLYADVLSELSIVPLPLPVERRLVSTSRAVKWRGKVEVEVEVQKRKSRARREKMRL
jgi:hypothetical protein